MFRQRSHCFQSGVVSIRYAPSEDLVTRPSIAPIWPGWGHLGLTDPVGQGPAPQLVVLNSKSESAMPIRFST